VLRLTEPRFGMGFVRSPEPGRAGAMNGYSLL
jgi:hypothetical protein